MGGDDQRRPHLHAGLVVVCPIPGPCHLSDRAWLQPVRRWPARHPRSTQPWTLTMLLDIRDYRLDFDTFDGAYKVLDGIDLSLAKGETLGVVGETGCGKSVQIGRAHV